MSIPAKLVLWTLVLATIAVSSLWLIGNKKKEYSAAIEIAAPPESVFLFLTDPDKHKSWVSGLTHVEAYSADSIGDDPMSRVTGTRIVERNGSKSQFEDAVIRFESNGLLSVQSSNSGQVITSIYELEPRDGEEKTNFNYRVIRTTRGINRLLAPLQKDNTQAIMDGDVRKLKDQVESGKESGL